MNPASAPASTAPAPQKRKGSRSSFVRTRVPAVERVVSVLIVALIAGIGVAVWIKGGHFNPDTYALRTDSLSSTAKTMDGKASTLRVEAGQASEGSSVKQSATTAASKPVAAAASATESAEPAASAPAPGEGGGAPAASNIKKEPLEIALPGIKPMGDTEFYSADDLYQKIDGRSPAYQGYNVQQLRCRTFSLDGPGGSYVDVYEYRMDNNVDAFGIFALERDPKGKALAFAKDGYSGEMGYFFRQGPIYVQIIASDQKPKTIEIAQAVAENRAKSLPADDSGLEGRRALPAAGLVAGSIQFTQDDALGQDFLKDVFQGTYDFGGKKLTYFVMATTPPAAETAWKAFLDFSGKYGGKATPLPDIAGAKVFQAENFGTFKVIYQRAGQLGGVVDAKEPKAAIDFVTQYLQGQIQ